MELTTKDPESCAHAVRFYDSTEDLASVVVGRLRAALDAGHMVVIIATVEHRAAFHAGLQQHGLDIQLAESGGRLVWLDAALALAGFTKDGVIDSAGFDSIIGALIRRAASAGRPVDAYGEMVALLWDAGHVAGAVELENLWNSLAGEVQFSLLCAYPSRLMQPAEALAGFSEVCDAHTHVVGGAPTAPDAELSRRFPASVAAPRQARRFVAESLQLWRRPELVDAAVLVTSELATNAVRHAGTDFTVSLTRSDGVNVVLSVGDSDPGAPQPRPADPAIPGGRGLPILDAITTRWGHRQVAGGKLVWAELMTPPRLP